MIFDGLFASRQRIMHAVLCSIRLFLIGKTGMKTGAWKEFSNLPVLKRLAWSF